MPNPQKVDKLLKKLLKHDPDFEVFESRGKGSERMIYHPNINGRAESYPFKYHGKNTELGRGTISAIIRRFNLPRDIFN